MKKIIKIYLTLLIALSMTFINPVNALSNNEFEYELLDDGTIEITGYNGSDTDVKIPSEIEGIIVTSIGDWAFDDCDKLTSISIPSGVLSIKANSILNCENLVSINVSPDNQYYSSRDGVLYNKNQTKVIKAPNKITEYIIPKDVTSIEYSAFWNCTSLTNITIPDNVLNIGMEAFCYCDNLISIIIPDSVTYIGESAFYGCDNLKVIDV